MPRFLNTWTGEFEWHPDPSKVTYAILSHVWRHEEQGGEQSYQDVLKIQEAVREGRSAVTETSPTEYHEEDTIFAHQDLSDKIKGFCKVARDAGFRLVWNDACCINKHVSTTDTIMEVQQAINSMYEWYRLSDMCYVYLADVPDGDVPWQECSKFRESRWHRRGWTLQELIAPKRMLFLTKTWNVLGTKMGLAKALEAATGVDFDILVGLAFLDSASVAKKMSWATQRQTTHVEDRAYSLLGIFGLHMSPIYGEGEKAFLRLQEKIIMTIPDQSIFAWGGTRTLKYSEHKDGWILGELGYKGGTAQSSGLLASSPDDFSEYSHIAPIHFSSLAQKCHIQPFQVPLVNCIFTPEGVNTRLICIPLSGLPDLRSAFLPRRYAKTTCAECRQLDPVDTLALIQCQEYCDAESITTPILALPLSWTREGGRSFSRAFHIGNHIHDSADSSLFYRVVSIDPEALFELLEHVRPTLEDVTLLRHYSNASAPKSLQLCDDLTDFNLATLRCGSNVSFDIAPHSVAALLQLGIVPSPLQATSSEQEVVLETTLTFSGDSHLGTPRAMELRLVLVERGEYIEACFSVKRSNVIGSTSDQSPFIKASSTNHSHHAAQPVNTPHTSRRFLDLDNRNGSRTFIPIDISNWCRRTIVYTQCPVLSAGMWSGNSRLLRIALVDPFASALTEYAPPSNLWLSIDISEEYTYASQTESVPDDLWLKQAESDVSEDETSNAHDNVFPICESTCLPVPADQEHTVYSSLDNVEALRQKNHAQPARTAPDDHHTFSPPSPTSTPQLVHKSGMWWFRLGRVVRAIGGKRRTQRSRAHESPRDAGAQHAREDVCDESPNRRENATLRTEIEQLKRRNADLSSELATVSSQNSVLASRVDAMFARLDALTVSPAANAE